MDNYLSNTAEHFFNHHKTLISGNVHPIFHPVAVGDSREHGWRELFRRFLPKRYSVKSGFIVDSVGNKSEQIDCIIFRKDLAIEFYAVDHQTVIPVEAVFGAFEIKPDITKKNLAYAEKKADSIADLVVTNTLNDDGTLFESAAKYTMVFGLLTDEIESSKKWNSKIITDFLRNQNSLLQMLVAIEDGWLEMRYPRTDNFFLYEGNHALLNQLISLTKIIAQYEKARCSESSYLTNYRMHLNQPIQKKLSEIKK